MTSQTFTPRHHDTPQSHSTCNFVKLGLNLVFMHIQGFQHAQREQPDSSKSHESAQPC
jgi:hypothetical protein